MATAARELGRPSAAALVAELVEAAADRRPLPETADIDRRSKGVADDRRRGHRDDGRDRVPFDPIALGTEIQRRIGVKTSRDEPLARFTTMRVGGPADLFAVAHNAFELRALVKFVRSRGIPHVILGRGSDVVIADAGVRGLVIQVRAEGTEVDRRPPDRRSGRADGPGRDRTQAAGLSGLEFGLAIPGTAGGAVWANAGAHESDVRAILDSALVMTADGTESRLDGAGLELGYRDSRLKHTRPIDPAAGGSAAGGLPPRPRSS